MHAHIPGLSNTTTAQKYLSATRFLDVTKVMEEGRGKFGPSTLEEKPGSPGLVSSPVNLSKSSSALPFQAQARRRGGKGSNTH